MGKEVFIVGKAERIVMNMGIAGGIPFFMGIAMMVMQEWKLADMGIIMAIIGLVILIAIFPVYYKIKSKTSF